MVGLTSLFSVMHESSKRISETLQEVYSSDWDGHEDLKAIVGVRECNLHSHRKQLQLPLPFSLPVRSQKHLLEDRLVLKSNFT